MSTNDSREKPLVLVTGATGFIGGHLLKGLVLVGYRVRALCRTPVSDDDIEGLEWVQTEGLSPKTDWNEFLDGVDSVVHLAALAHESNQSRKSSDDAYYQVNAGVTEALVTAVRDNGSIRRMIFLSTIGVIATTSSLVVDEKTPCNPDTVYAKSKLEAEERIQSVLSGSGTDWCILRPPVVYGPGNPGNMDRLRKLVLTGIPLPFGSICNQRSFIYVGNLSGIIIHVIGFPAKLNRVYCVADNQSLSTPELINLICQAVDRSDRCWPCPLWLLGMLGHGGDFFRSVFGTDPGINSYSVERLVGSLAIDAASIHKELQWRPPFTIEEGLVETFGSGKSH